MKIKSGSGYPFLFVTVLLFSTFEVVSKTLTGLVDPLQINFIRFFLGGVILLIPLIIKKDLKITVRQALELAGIGIVNTVLSMSLLQISLSFPGASASVVAVVFSSNPIFVMLFAAIFDGESVSPAKVVGLLIGMAGILTVFSGKLQLSGTALTGPLLALASAVFYGLYTVLGRRVSLCVGSLKMNAYSFLFGSVLFLPFLFFTGTPVFSMNVSALPQVLYLSVFVTGLAYLSYFMGLEKAGAGKGSLVFFLKPVLASLIAVIFLHEELSVGLVFGVVLVIVGIAAGLYGDKFLQLRGSRQEPEE